jgi:hypothetical protein
MVVPSHELVPPVHRLAASPMFQERGNREATGMLPAIAMRCVRRKAAVECPLKGAQHIFDGLITTARVLFQSTGYHALKRARKRGIEEGRSHLLRFLMIQAVLIAWSIDWHGADKPTPGGVFPRPEDQRLMPTLSEDPVSGSYSWQTKIWLWFTRAWPHVQDCSEGEKWLRHALCMNKD